ncbi:MAG: hypothetical protein C6Y22_28980 [Hapalosiphonaceae cyanobacterium JJU2]|nr:MAG: hypothetical protein C6Y22_28980 [Hapalosiphonaceae cyanobacterium JJU2]
MKSYLKIIVAILALTTGLAANSQAVSSQNVKKTNFLLTQAPVKVKPVPISVALPALADISLKGGESVSGRVTAIDPSGQTLSMSRSGKTLPFPLKQVEKVVFRNNERAYRSNGNLIYRGERDRPQGQQVTWNGLPLSTFIIKNANQGLAVVNLEPPVVSPEWLRGIESVAKDRQYVVDEMQFNLQQKTMSIRATPY